MSGRVVVVTGGGRGIGAGIVRRFVAEGATVVVADLSYDQADAALLDQVAWAAEGDLTDPAFRDGLVQGTVERYGRIDVLVNNAGMSSLRRGDLLELSPESWHRVLDVNLTATMFLTQAVARVMVAQEPRDGRRGVIVNTGSLNSYHASPDRADYCVSKVGVSMLTQVFAARLAGDGIHVHEVRPGVIETPMTSVVHEKYSRMIEDGQFPIARWGQPDDVARAVALLCSDELPYSTGQVVDVDGGFHIRRL